MLGAKAGGADAAMKRLRERHEKIITMTREHKRVMLRIHEIARKREERFMRELKSVLVDIEE